MADKINLSAFLILKCDILISENMKKEAKLFLIMCIITGLLFILGGYSLISCFVFGMDQEAIGTSILEISYLFIQLVALGILFYLFFRAMKFGSFFVRGLTMDPNGIKYKGKQIVFAIFGGLFFLLSIYATLQVFGLKLPLYEFMGLTIWHDLMNAFLLITLIFVLFFVYPYCYNHEDYIKKNDRR